MLQLERVNREALRSPELVSLLGSVPPGGPDLETHADLTVSALRAERARLARQGGLVSRLGTMIDESLRTDAVEHMDDPDYPDRGKFAIAQGLHLLNAVTGSYGKFFALLEPIVASLRRQGRTARILELACGAGGFSFAVAAIAEKRGLPVTITGSDIVPSYVERATRKAAKRGSSARFRRIDALDMSDIEARSYDIVFIAQSVHHFTPGQLSRMIAESRRVATTAFVSVDGYRSVPMIGFVAGTAMMTMWPAMVHDAVISVRKFYGERELDLIGRMGAPKATVTVGRIWPLNTTLTVRFDTT